MTVRGASNANGALNGRADGLASSFGPRRGRILEILDAYPGLNLDEVAVAVGVRRTAAKHHLGVLERTGHVTRVRWGRHRLHFTQNVPPTERILFCLFRVPSLHRLTQTLMTDPSLDRGRLATRLQVTPRTVRRALRMLTRHGLIRAQVGPEGPVAVLHPRLRVLLAREPAGPAEQEPASPLEEDAP